jgi:putative ABC transport system ATP-binding protein
MRVVVRLICVSKDYAAPAVSGARDGEVVHALREVSLEVDRGEFVAVMGPSGCGKSTLLHIAGGLDAPSTGEVWVDDQPIHRMQEHNLSLFRRQRVGVIFQFFNLLPQLTALENVCIPLRLLGVAPSEAETRASALLDEVGLRGKSARLPAELSGGEQQRVAIARALAHRPRIVLADEPTGNLDSATSATVLAVLKDLQDAYQTTLLLVTHSTEVARVARRTVAMQDGQIVSKTVHHPNII